MINVVVIATMPAIANAQNSIQGINEDVFNACAAIFTAGLVMVFILAIIKRIMDYRIKNKIVEKGVPENIVSSILQTSPKENKNTNIKWFALLAGIGAGLTIIYYTLPLGIHSLAIMAFCIAASFLGYYFFLQQSEK